MKFNININNYEAFWIDYLDGNLTKHQENEFMEFLEQNPLIAGNLIDVEDFKLPVYEKEFPEKSALYNNNQIENLLIAKIEGTISSENDAFITNKIKKDRKIANLYSIYKKTVLVPDTKIVFPNKKSLKKTVRVPLFRYVSAAAGMIIILAVSVYFLNINIKPINNETPSISAKLKHTIHNQHIKDSFTNDEHKILTPINNVNPETNTSFAKIENEPIKLNVPKRLQLHKVTKLDYEIAFSTTNIMEYRNDLPPPQKQNQFVEYTIEYKKSKKENKFVAGLKNIVNLSKEVDVIEKWENIKKKKEEFLYTNLEK
ncbi:MAG: hypothetical protein PHP52_01045 [Bacteroidales bacterium]|nr:hypothetical protein [Bacteroidales bacterium]MDD4216142.1 hypothetical protein [Bacteroidales bacterium]MDY0141896.1 hypothetical protein [Bacteroidales bacterium]